MTVNLLFLQRSTSTRNAVFGLAGIAALAVAALAPTIVFAQSDEAPIATTPALMLSLVPPLMLSLPALDALPALGSAGTVGAVGTASPWPSVLPASIPISAITEAELRSWCDPVTRVLPKIKLKPCMRAGLAPTGATSVKGLPIMAREVFSRHEGASQISEPAARVLVIGGIHGDELTSSAIVFRWLEWIEQNEAQPYQWQIVPVLNPDGLLAKPATRVNASGVDLNRNFPTPNWAKEAPKYWAVKTSNDPRRFPGKAAISEPESRWLHSEIKRFKPDVIISVHAPFGVLDFDGPVDPPHKLGALILTPVGIYPGSLGNYGGVHQGVPVVTIELPHALELPNDAELKNIWRDMLAWIAGNVARKKTSNMERVISGADEIVAR